MIINWFDLLLIVWIASTSHKGFQRRFCGAMIYFFGFYISIPIAVIIGPKIGNFLIYLFPDRFTVKTMMFTGFGIIFIIVMSLTVIYSYLPRNWSRECMNLKIDRSVGVYFGFLLGLITSGFFVFIVSLSSNPFLFKHFYLNSLFAPILVHQLNNLYFYYLNSSYFSKYFGYYMEFLG